MIIYTNLINAIKESPMKQGIIAKRSRITPETLSRIKHGKNLPTAPHLKSLCETLEISIDFALAKEKKKQ